MLFIVEIKAFFDILSFISGIFFSNFMGTKNKPAASKDKAPKEAKSKGRKDKGEGGPQKAEIIVSLNEDQAIKFIKNAKVITVQELAKQTGVKISATNSFLRQSIEKGLVKRVGGYSGHHIYQPVSS